MLIMATAGLILAMMTRAQRRANDRGIVRDRSRATPFLAGQSDVLPPPQPRSPASLEALRYLPARTNLLVGVHVAELDADSSGKQLLRQPMQLGPARVGLGEVARWTGVPLENIDHLVLGLDSGSGTIPRINLVVRTRRAYDRQAILGNLEARKVSDVPASETRTWYRTRFEAIRLPVALWCADDRTLVFGLTVIDLNDVPRSPHPTLDHLPAALTEVLEKRLIAGSPFWLAASVDDWEQLNRTIWFGWIKSKMSLEDLNHLTGIRAGAGWIQLGDVPSGWAVFRSGDEPRARGLINSIREGLGDLPVTMIQDDVWVTLQFKMNFDRLLRSLGD